MNQTPSIAPVPFIVLGWLITAALFEVGSGDKKRVEAR